MPLVIAHTPRSVPPGRVSSPTIIILHHYPPLLHNVLHHYPPPQYPSPLSFIRTTLSPPIIIPPSTILHHYPSTHYPSPHYPSYSPTSSCHQYPPTHQSPPIRLGPKPSGERVGVKVTTSLDPQAQEFDNQEEQFHNWLDGLRQRKQVPPELLDHLAVRFSGSKVSHGGQHGPRLRVGVAVARHACETLDGRVPIGGELAWESARALVRVCRWLASHDVYWDGNGARVVSKKLHISLRV